MEKIGKPVKILLDIDVVLADDDFRQFYRRDSHI